jgi:hypothetical protein
MQTIRVLLSFIATFFTSETGAVRQSTSLPLAWAAGVLAGAATLLGATAAGAVERCGTITCGGVEHYDCCPVGGGNCWISQWCDNGFYWYTCSGVC